MQDRNSGVLYYSTTTGPGGPVRWAGEEMPINAGARQNLHLFVSHDEASSWQLHTVVDSGLTSYSSLAVLAGGGVAVLWETGYMEGTPEAIIFREIAAAIDEAAVEVPAGVLKTVLKTDDNGRNGTTAERWRPSLTTTVACTNVSDCTDDIQAALSDVDTAHVIIPDNGHVWISRTLVMNRSHVLLTLRPGVVLQALRGAFHTPADLILVDGGINISIVGPGASLRMWRSDYANASLYTHSEDRMGISSYDTINLTISDLEIAETGKYFLHMLPDLLINLPRRNDTPLPCCYSRNEFFVGLKVCAQVAMESTLMT